MAKLLNRDALAARLEISPARVQQLTAQGVLERGDGGYDLADCAIALLRYIRRNEAQEAAKTRRITAAAAISERRQRVALGTLATLDEVRTLLDDQFGRMHGALQAGSSEAFASISAELGDFKARPLTHAVYDPMLGALIRWRDGCLEALKEMRAGLRNGARLDSVIAELAHSVSDGAEDDEDGGAA